MDFVSRSSKITSKQEESLAMTGNYRMRSVPVTERLRKAPEPPSLWILPRAQAVALTRAALRALVKTSRRAASLTATTAGWRRRRSAEMA